MLFQLWGKSRFSNIPSKFLQHWLLGELITWINLYLRGQRPCAAVTVHFWHSKKSSREDSFDIIIIIKSEQRVWLWNCKRLHVGNRTDRLEQAQITKRRDNTQKLSVHTWLIKFWSFWSYTYHQRTFKRNGQQWPFKSIFDFSVKRINN